MFVVQMCAMIAKKVILYVIWSKYGVGGRKGGDQDQGLLNGFKKKDWESEREREREIERERKKDDGSSLIFLTYKTVNISLLQNNFKIYWK